VLRGREATPEDAAALAIFRCAEPAGEPWARDVENWISELLSWRSQCGGRHVRLYEDSESSRLVAVAAYRCLLDGQPQSGFFLYLLAVSVEDRRSPARHGKSIFLGLIQHLGTLEPGNLLVWMIDARNIACFALCSSLSVGEPISSPDWKGYLEYKLSLPDG